MALPRLYNYGGIPKYPEPLSNFGSSFSTSQRSFEDQPFFYNLVEIERIRDDIRSTVRREIASNQLPHPIDDVGFIGMGQRGSGHIIDTQYTSAHNYQVQNGSGPPRSSPGTMYDQNGSGIIDSIKQFLFFPPNKLPGDSQKVFDTYKDATVLSLKVLRAPIIDHINRIANILSRGGWDLVKKKLGYDYVNHLSLIIDTSMGPVMVEKNERINLTTKIKSVERKPGSQIFEVDYNGDETLEQFFGNALKLMGEQSFFQYNAKQNNCQDFVLALLKANGVLTPEIKQFIKQDANALYESLPGWAASVSQFITDTAGKIREWQTGQGKKSKKGKHGKKHRQKP